MKKLLRNLVPEKLSRIIKELVLHFNKYYYSGNSVYCPICDNHFRSFRWGGFDLEVIKTKEIIGAGKRQNLCPHCQSTDRDRLIYYFLTKKLSITEQKIKILHVAPEPALYKFLKRQKNLIYITGTKYSEGIYFHENIDTVDLLDIPYKNEEFDMVICNHVLEHINDDAKAMKEIYRVLIPGGTAIVQVPISYKIKETYEDGSIVNSVDREKHFGQFDHVRIYGADYKDRLEKAGFRVDPFNAFDEDFDSVQLDKSRLNPKEKLFVAYKDK